MKRLLLTSAVALALGGIAYMADLGHPIAQTTFPGPVATAVAVTNAGVQLVAANPSRRAIEICNTGGTNGLWIWPGATATPVSFREIPPVASSATTCYVSPLVGGGAGAAWQGMSLTTTAGIVEW